LIVQSSSPAARKREVRGFNNDHRVFIPEKP
jgi:hypothetical protein